MLQFPYRNIWIAEIKRTLGQYRNHIEILHKYYNYKLYKLLEASEIPGKCAVAISWDFRHLLDKEWS